MIGGTGFIGCYLARELHARGNKVSVYSNVSERDGVLALGIAPERYIASNFYRETSFSDVVRGADVVIHLVCSLLPGSSSSDIGGEIARDIHSTVRLLESCVREKIPRVVLISSGGTVYGNGTPPFRETDPLRPVSHYGYLKVATEQLFEFYGRCTELDVKIIRLSNPFGPGQDFRSGVGVISAFIDRAIDNLPLEIYGDGSAERDFIFIEDAVRGIVRVALEPSRYTTYNLGSGKGTSIEELAALVQSISGNTSGLVYRNRRTTDVKESYLHMERFNSQFGEIVTTPLYEGILRTYIQAKASRS